MSKCFIARLLRPSEQAKASSLRPGSVQQTPVGADGDVLWLQQVTQVANERAEAEVVVSIMERLHKQGRHQWKDMAILYRTNAQSRLFEEQLVSWQC